MNLIGISAGELRVTLAPLIGGSMAGFTRHWHDDSGRPHDLCWLRAASPEALALRNPLGMASFPLVPFCNRIRHGRAVSSGRAIRLAPNHPGADEQHPLHGVGWLRPWDVVTTTTSQAELALNVPQSDEWPWHFSARQRFELSSSRLDITMSVTNHDTVPMPAGIGHHPYFPHEPGTRITAHTLAMWHADAEVMPTRLGPADAVDKLKGGVEVAQLDLDNNFTGWQRHALIEWPADRYGPARQLSMTAHAPLDYFVLYCPAGFDHFCAEPVSQCTDWINLLETCPRESVGGAMVAPGESLEVRFALQPSWQSS